MSEMTNDPVSSNSFIEEKLTESLNNIGGHLKCDVITIVAPMQVPFDELVRDAMEEVAEREEKSGRLLIILETAGGSIDVVERIADAIRHHYPDHVSFLVPNFAMSAGTVLVMSGDAIYMDYFSCLGPIDPQVKSRRKGDIWVPAIGYIETYNDFIRRSKKGELSDLEIMFFIDKYDPAELHAFEQARDLSVELLKKWLVKYKFKDWDKTESRGRTVTQQMKETRASDVAKKLNEVGTWKSHSRSLSRLVVENQLKLRIDDFSSDRTLNKLVRSYYRLLQDYSRRVGQSVIIHTAVGYQGY